MGCCVCKPLTAKRLSFLLFFFKMQGAQAHGDTCAGKRRLITSVYLQLSMYRDMEAERSGHRPQNCSERETLVGVIPSKELCKCVTSTGILSKGRA